MSNTYHSISLEDIVPDIYLLDLGVSILEEHDLKISTTMKEGGFGTVFKADISGETVALKSLLEKHIDETASKEELKYVVLENIADFRREIATMARLQHPCIVKLKSVFMQKLWFVLEFAPYGDLGDYVNDQFQLPDIEWQGQDDHKELIVGTALERRLTFKIVYQIVNAVEYLHDRGVIHADLKTNNILLFSTKLQDTVNAKLGDYGISQYAATGVVRGHATQHAFAAPEIKEGKAFDDKVSISILYLEENLERNLSVFLLLF